MKAGEFLGNFEPYDFDEVTRRLLEVQQEILSKATEILALYFDSLAGYSALQAELPRWRDKIRAELKEDMGIEMDENTWKIIEPLRSPPPHGQWSYHSEFAQSLANYRMRLTPSGANSLLIGNFLLIALYQYWEDSWRPNIAKALQIGDKNLIRSDFWGDLRLIRICLIHKRDLADVNLEKKPVHFRWFKAGETIHINREKVEAIINGLHRFLYSELPAYKDLR